MSNSARYMTKNKKTLVDVLLKNKFPEIVDAFGKEAKVSKILGGDGIERTKLEIEGSYRGKSGIFEYIIEQDGKTVNHRLFVPYKNQ